MKTIEINLKERSFKLKESDLTFIGIAVTVILYAMNIIGTGIFVGGDIGHLDTEIPYYGFVAPVLFIAFAAFMGYFTKKYSLKNTFIATYVTLALPVASYLPAAIGIYLPFMFLCMPVSSLFTYLYDEICDLLEPTIDAIAQSMEVASYKVENCILIPIVIALLIPLIVAPVVYRFTKTQKCEE